MGNNNTTTSVNKSSCLCITACTSCMCIQEKVDDDKITAENRLSSQEHQLYKTLESHGDQFDIDYIKLSLDKYQQDLAARSRIAATPILAPEKSKPVQVAMPELATPKKPVKGPRPVKYAGAVSGAGMAGLSSGLASLAAATASIGD